MVYILLFEPGLLFGGDGEAFLDEPEMPADKEDAVPERTEGMDAVTVPLDVLDALVESFTGAVALLVLPGVLDIGTVVTDRIDAAPDAG